MAASPASTVEHQNGTARSSTGLSREDNADYTYTDQLQRDRLTKFLG